jgi:hypothetical protein
VGDGAEWQVAVDGGPSLHLALRDVAGRVCGLRRGWGLDAPLFEWDLLEALPGP